MSRAQTLVLAGTAAAIIVTLLFPPYRVPVAQNVYRAGGYSFLFAPPSRLASVNVGLLFMEWLGILLVGGIVWFMVRRQGTNRAVPPPECD